MSHQTYVEHERIIEKPAVTNTNVNATPTTTNSPLFTVTNLVILLFTILEVSLLARFVGKLLSANEDQPLVSSLYAFTQPLVAPFQGIFPASGTFDTPALLAIGFFLLVGAFVSALTRALAYRNTSV